MEEILADRPDCPYKPGFQAEILSHTPPEPFIPQRDFWNPDWYTDRERDAKVIELSRMELVMYSPPVERMPSPIRNAKAVPPVASQLTVTKAIAVGDLRGAQVVLCTIEPPQQPSFIAVAKIYDPLYWPFLEQDSDGYETELCLEDTPRLADSEYSREAAAYEQLRDKKLTEGSFTPKYYGSFTLTLSASHENRPEKTRKVRLILIEHIDGISMHNLMKTASGDYIGESLWQQLDEQYRLNVWARMLECDSLIRHAFVSHCDNYPRNRIIAPSPRNSSGGPMSSSKLRVVLIDFGNSSVWTRSDHIAMRRRYEAYKHELPVNPIVEQWDKPFAWPYTAWVPDWYFTDRAKRHRWLIDEFIKGGEDKKYETVENIPVPGTVMHVSTWPNP